MGEVQGNVVREGKHSVKEMTRVVRKVECDESCCSWNPT